MSNLVERLLFATITGIGAYATNELKSLNENIQTLNVKMAVIVERVQKLDEEQAQMKMYLLGQSKNPLNPRPLFKDKP